MTSRLLEIISGNLRAYAQLQPESMLHCYELTNERRTCPDKKLREELRNNSFYTADGQFYTATKREVLWGITLLPQNLVLRNLEEAYRQLTQTNNYFPPTKEARTSFEHADTKVIDLKGLELVKDDDEHGHFVINPQKVKELNSQQKKAAVRLFGPDEASFGLNMEMLAEAGKLLWVFTLMPDYVQRTLEAQDKQYLGRASWLRDFSYFSSFNANNRVVYLHGRVRGVRRASEASSEVRPQGTDAPVVQRAVPEELEALLGEFNVRDPAELRKALQLYTTAKDLKI